jgi:carboxypeptidase C (cathepsin A)
VYETNKDIHLKNGIYLISAVTEKSHNVEEEDEADAKAGSSKTRSSSETTRVSATNLASVGSAKETQYQRDKSNEDIRENHEDCEYFGICSSYKERLDVYSLVSFTPSLSFEQIGCSSQHVT